MHYLPQDIKKKKGSSFAKFLLSFSLISLFTAFAIFFISNWFVNYQIHENTKLVNNTRTFEFWQEPPATIIRKYYFFSIANAYQVQKGTEKPRLIEKGPYTYVEKWEKRNVEFLGHEIVRFSPVIFLYFEPSLSNGSESDQITLLNIPAMGLIEDSVKGNSEKYIANMVTYMQNTKLFVKRTVKSFMGGYEDDLLGMAHMMMPEKIKSNVFSLLMGKNGTDHETLSIMTGNGNPKDKGKIVDWNGHKKLDYWYSEEANQLKGTDSTMYSPFISREDKLYAFNSEMCRSFYFEYKEDKALYGMDLFTFHAPRDLFYNSTLNPLNEGYCSNDCLGNGVQNISRCYGGLSGFISQPHFMNAEEKFKDAVIGMNVNETLHSTYVDFEPNTGVPIHGNIRFMVSFYLPGDPEINLIANVKSVLLPMMWFDESFDLNEDVRNELTQVALIVKLSSEFSILGIYIGMSLLSFSILFLMVKYIKNKLNHTIMLVAPVNGMP